MAQLWSPFIADDPLAFVMFVYPWGVQGTPLEHFTGPRRWQRKVLRRIARHIAEGKEISLPELLRLARRSGRGIGKSTFVAWVIDWFNTTRVGSSSIVSANTETQLRTITWAELSKWTAMSIHEHWWEVSGITRLPAKWLKELVETQLQKGTAYWGAFGKLWSEENPDAYAGVHNHDGVLVVFDEASGIVDGIWSVANGFFTEPTPNRIWLAFSQGRRNTGYFHEIFGKKRDLWDAEEIDARDVEGTDPKIYQEIIEEYGEDSDEARVEVYGMSPKDDGESFISLAVVDRAIKRGKVVPAPTDKTAPITIGVDPSGGGSDKFVIVVRQGMTILEIMRFKIADDEQGTMLGVQRIGEMRKKWKPDIIVCDTGMMGKPIVDRCNELRYKVKGVNFSWKSSDARRWANKRVEMWARMKKWMETAVLPDDQLLRTDLTGVKKKQPNLKGALQLESKGDMRGRGLASPDSADALACTFAFQVATSNDRVGAGSGGIAPVVRVAAQVGATSTSWMGH